MKSISRTLIMLVLASIIAFGLTGCAKETIVATVNSEKVSEPLYRIFLWSTQRGLESILPDIWDVDPIEGKTPEEFAKERALKSITYYVAVKQKAEEAGINKLTKEEKSAIKESAKNYVETNKEFVTNYGIKQKDYEKFLEYGKLEEKVVSQLGGTYIPNEEELKEAMKVLEEEGEFTSSATITHVLIKNKDEQGNTLPSDKDAEAKKRAEDVLNQALNGEDLTILARKYSEDAAVSTNDGQYTFKKGEMEESLEEVVFNEAKIGAVYPKLIETSMGYEIVKVEELNDMDEVTMKEAAIRKIQQDFVNHELSELSATYKVEKTESYENIHIMNLGEES
ncbi:peptidylprolyl isomerase [Cellulosilyticum lentocellum]|uniref:PpiC-type peptidyl-prolyl cis-trans isomerase n=1 Tax=Cellulosilyticum lentocellum (strain ATCC 49066 / DSM 5427 / NCIMB 11756 / RHM5) TaxID=642492 RepID=F2JS21_CELLD|nr:peptidylprolyl isomerase [Cellulosilyticum lentocellum]ADZ82835.1 PpiC-type peptidyl-prolyl cis-trans isomerase [Cellulosilyticum lentocellum DSM 5427]